MATSNLKKELAVAGPAHIEFNKTTGEFVLTLKAAGLDDLFYSTTDPKFLELYV